MLSWQKRYYSFADTFCSAAGHNAILHACTVEDESFVGMGSTLLDGVTVQKGAMVAAGSLVTQKTTVPAGEVSNDSVFCFLIH